MIDFLHLAHDLGDIMAVLKDAAVVLAAAVTACAAAVTAYCAWRGLSEWRKKLRGEVNFDVARRLLEATLRLDGGFQNFRMPFCFPNERPAAGGDKPDREILAKRRQTLNSKWLEFVARSVEAEAIWGDDLGNATKGMQNVGIEMSFAFRKYAEKGEDCDQAIKDIVIGTVERGDKFDTKLEAATNSIKLFLADKLDL